MIDVLQEKIRLLVKVSKLYYEDGLNQQEISNRLGISRPQVSLMLTNAKMAGIVQITMKNPFSEEQEYERAIVETFGIRDAIVVRVATEDQQMIEQHLARVGVALLENVLKDYDTVGVMSGKTIASLVNEMDYFNRKQMQFVPLVGWGSECAPWNANYNTRAMGEKLKSKYWELQAPAIMASEQVRDFAGGRAIENILNLGKKANVALINIRSVFDQATDMKPGYVEEKEMEMVRELGAAAIIGTSFLKANGQRIPYPTESRRVGLNAYEIRNIPNVIAFASGNHKVAAITAALRGRYVDVLGVDMETAKKVLKWHRLDPP